MMADKSTKNKEMKVTQVLKWIDDYSKNKRKNIEDKVKTLENEIQQMRSLCDVEHALYEEAVQLLKTGIEYNTPIVAQSIEDEEKKLYEEMQQAIGAKSD